LKLNVIWRTLTITKNPFSFFLLKQRKTRKAITFKNGLTYRLTWPQFRYIRDSYQLLSKYTLNQLEDDIFELRTNDGSITCSVHMLPVICDLSRDYHIYQEQPNLYHLKNDKTELVGTFDMLICIQEQRTGEYDCNCQGKVVLDVGGFEGESAVFFWQKGATKIIIYEPIAAYIEYIRRNIALNEINAEVYLSGIGPKTGKTTIYYDNLDPGSGIHSKGSSSIEIQLTDASKVIEQSGADIGKFDCESAEQYLVNVPASILRKISYYIIEVHSIEIRKSILNKFENSGFVLKKEIPKHSNFSVLVFQKVKN